MEPKPSRAKRRISSRPSQGLKARLSRSTRCALVSFVVLVVATFVIVCFARKNKNPPPGIAWRWVYECRVKKEFLGQQPPRASAHACTTTTGATARHAEIAAI